MRKLPYFILTIVLLMVVATIGGSFYMLDYALAPSPDRKDTSACFQWLFETYPQTRPWVDSLRRAEALRDTFVVMPRCERHHAYIIRQRPRSNKTAVLIHGWRDQAIWMMSIGQVYERMGYNLVLPDLHAHGLSDGEAVGMGWQERRDILHWMSLFLTDTMVVHGVSMGAATAMNVSGEQMHEGIRSLKFVEDCGYTSVWDEFSYEMGEEFGLSDFPLMYSTSLLCRLKYGWSFGEAAPLRQIARCRYPMLLIHGDSDDFVPSWMVRRLYDAKPEPKRIWVTRGVQHAHSFKDYPEEYARRLSDFLEGF